MISAPLFSDCALVFAKRARFFATFERVLGVKKMGMTGIALPSPRLFFPRLSPRIGCLNGIAVSVSQWFVGSEVPAEILAAVTTDLIFLDFPDAQQHIVAS